MLSNFHSFIGSLEIQSLTYDTVSGVLTCISTGGPTTGVTWNRSGQVYNQNKIVDTVNGIYHNLLTITSSQISDYTGSFNCTVRNIRGSKSWTTGDFKGIHFNSFISFGFNVFDIQLLDYLVIKLHMTLDRQLVSYASVTSLYSPLDGSICPQIFHLPLNL